MLVVVTVVFFERVRQAHATRQSGEGRPTRRGSGAIQQLEASFLFSAQKAFGHKCVRHKVLAARSMRSACSHA